MPDRDDAVRVVPTDGVCSLARVHRSYASGSSLASLVKLGSRRAANHGAKACTTCWPCSTAPGIIGTLTTNIE